MTQDQKQTLTEATLTLFYYTLGMLAYTNLFPDDEDDSFKKLYKRYLLDNVSQQYNVNDLLRTLSNTTPIVFTKMFKASEVTANLFWAGIYKTTGFGNEKDLFTNEGKIQGYSDFLKLVPFVSSYHETKEILKHDESLNLMNIR